MTRSSHTRHGVRKGIVMKICRLVLTALTVLIGLAAPVDTAHAAAPGNDTFAGALAVPIGFSDYLDTTEATTDGVDAELNTCFSAADASVWYSITGNGADVIVDVLLTTYNSYSAGVIIATGSPGNFQQIACDTRVQFFAEVDTTYYVLAVDTQVDGGGNGGLLQINILPAPTLELSVDRVGQVKSRDGVATISGTYTCAGPDGVFIQLFLSQVVGRFKIEGSGSFAEVGTCDGSPRIWSITLEYQNGRFSGGNATAVVSAVAPGPTGTVSLTTTATVQLRSSRH